MHSILFVVSVYHVFIICNYLYTKNMWNVHILEIYSRNIFFKIRNILRITTKTSNFIVLKRTLSLKNSFLYLAYNKSKNVFFFFYLKRVWVWQSISYLKCVLKYLIYSQVQKMLLSINYCHYFTGKRRQSSTFWLICHILLLREDPQNSSLSLYPHRIKRVYVYI